MKQVLAKKLNSVKSESSATGIRPGANAPPDAAFQSLAEGSMQGIVVVAPGDWKLLFANDSYARMLGFENAAEILSLGSLESIVDTADLARLKSQEKSHNPGDGPCDRTYRVRRQNGSSMDFSDRVRPISWHGETAWLATTLDNGNTEKIVEAPRQSDPSIDHILNNIADSLVTIDEAGTILSFNHAAEHMFGYAAAEVIGNDISLLAPEPHKSRHQEYVDSYLKSGTSGILGHGPRELEGCHKNGSIIPMELSISEMRVRGRRTFIGAMRDISRRKLMENALHLAMEEAEIANRARKNFLATMSHELRTPLHAIIGFSEIIKDELFGPVGASNYLEYARDIRDSGQHLLKLIGEILDYSKVESGKMGLTESEVDVPEVIDTCVALTRELVSRGILSVKIDIPSGLPALWADKPKLNQVLTNLFANAAKFTKPGGKIGIRTWAKSDSGFIFQIYDTGIGMALGDIPKALAPFGQLDGALNRQYQGSGLGLPLSKRLIELHGGSLDLQSELGKGTIVTARFPSERIRDHAA
jgi:PAS domain S-box-containing protein